MLRLQRRVKVERGGIGLAPGARRNYLWGGITKGRTMVSLLQAIDLVLSVAWFFILAHLVMSWLINFQVLNLHQPIVAQIWVGLNRILEPIYGPIRRVLPNTGPLDLAPLVAIIAIIILRNVIANNIMSFV